MNNLPKDLEQLLEKMMRTGKLAPDQVRDIMRAADDPANLDDILEKLELAGVGQVGHQAPLNIADYYRDSAETFELQWPLQAALPIPFDQLDRKTRFFVLFQEWTRRELQGNAALGSGDNDNAEALFSECLQRAEQLQVPELRARSYEGLMRVAQKRGDPKAELSCSQSAVKARAANG